MALFAFVQLQPVIDSLQLQRTNAQLQESNEKLTLYVDEQESNLRILEARQEGQREAIETLKTTHKTLTAANDALIAGITALDEQAEVAKRQVVEIQRLNRRYILEQLATKAKGQVNNIGLLINFLDLVLIPDEKLPATIPSASNGREILLPTDRTIDRVHLAARGPAHDS